MRFAIGLLLALNVLYAAWVVVRPASSGPQEVVSLSAPPLHLVAVGSMDLPAEVEGSLCIELGPFVDEDSLRAFASRMLADSLWSLAPRELPEVIRHRVYVPPVVGRAQAQRQLDTVRAIIEEMGEDIDSYLITAGDLDNAVSLGVFAELNNARRVQDWLAGQPVGVMIREEGRVRNEYWLRVLTDKMLDFSTKNDLQPGFHDVIAMLEQNVCETIAQHD